ncbi:MAG: hypothetical protein ACLR8Y_07145 [Alistipes indistinctus]
MIFAELTSCIGRLAMCVLKIAEGHRPARTGPPVTRRRIYRPLRETAQPPPETTPSRDEKTAGQNPSRAKPD